MAVRLTAHACLVVDRFLDNVLSEARTGQITWLEAQNEIAEAATKLLEQHPDAIQYMELRCAMAEGSQRGVARQRRTAG